jgi:RND family efflux transporter MFP subunit
MKKSFFPHAPGRKALGAALASLLLVACAPAPAPEPVVPAVFVSPVHNDSGLEERVFSGSLRPRVEAELGFRVGGKVVLRAVELGQRVRAGQVLGRLDPADYQLAERAAAEQERAAEVDATQAASDAARFQRLLADGSVGGADAERQQARADAASARLAQARRQAELARNRAAYAVLTAPFDGTVTALRFETGQQVGEAQAVLSLARPGEWELQVDLPEGLVPGLADWRAEARLGAGGPLLPVRLREIAPSAAAASRTYRARYALAGSVPAEALRIGMTAELLLSQAQATPGADLPVGALLTSAAQAPTVWLVDARSGALQAAPVRLLSQTTDRVRVAGLPDGALVVTVGAQTLDAGLRVRPVQRPLAALAEAAR